MPDQSGDSRMQEMERWAREHEVKCMERYTQILAQSATNNRDVGELRTWLSRRMDWLLAIICALALTRVFTPEQIAEFIKAVFR
jgi:hypothetical protein